jgi:hypothetical protein
VLFQQQRESGILPLNNQRESGVLPLNNQRKVDHDGSRLPGNL